MEAISIDVNSMKDKITSIEFYIDYVSLNIVSFSVYTMNEALTYYEYS